MSSQPPVQQPAVQDRLESGSASLLNFLQAEYQALKMEQTTRIAIRENAIYVNFVAVAAIATVAFAQSPPKLPVLLAIPFCTCCMYWVYVNNDIMVTHLRKFFRDEFPRRVLTAMGKEQDAEFAGLVNRVIGTWEHYHRSKHTFRKPRKVMNTLVVVASFLTTSVASLLATGPLAWRSRQYYLAFWLLESALTLLMLVVFFATADW
jgi:hypothetical protein